MLIFTKKFSLLKHTANTIISSNVSTLVEWLEYPTPVREGPGSKPESIKKFKLYIRWMY